MLLRGEQPMELKIWDISVLLMVHQCLSVTVDILHPAIFITFIRFSPNLITFSYSTEDL